MKKLIEGILEFRNSLTEENRALFADLALGQKPNALFIACSDSRVVPNLFASTNPGDLFVLRNVGNLVPSYAHQDTGTLAALEFAVLSLKVKDIVVCGHSECGAMQSLINQTKSSCCSHLPAWLSHAESCLSNQTHISFSSDELASHNKASQMNVLEQIDHLISYPFIEDLVNKKALRLHGWWFDIARADVYCYESNVAQFKMIDQQEAKLILARLG
ncbi:MAG: carbonic anhydrase [Rhabdochlamydiaceae bacterium]